MRVTYPTYDGVVGSEVRFAVLAAEYAVRVEVCIVDKAHLDRGRALTEEQSGFPELAQAERGRSLR